MARSHVRLELGLWRKPGHTDVPKDGRLLYVTILGDEALNQAGVVVLRPSVWAEDAAMTDAEVETALRELELRRFVVIDSRTQELLVRTFIRNDGVADQPNVLRNALAVAAQVRSPKLRKALAAELRRLPPPQPDRKTPSGRVFSYPDPYATARELDPEDDLPPGDRLGPSNPSGNPSPNPSDMGPGTLPDPLKNRTLEPFAEPFGEPMGGRVRGRGRGRGEGSSPVTTQVQIKTDDDAREAKPASTGSDHRSLAAQAVTTAVGTSRPKAIRDALIGRATALLADGTTGADLVAALYAWRTTPDARVSWLDHKVSDIVSRREASNAPPTRPRSTTDQRVQACLDRAAIYEEAVAHGHTTPAEQFAYAFAKLNRPLTAPEQAMAEVIALPHTGKAS